MARQRCAAPPVVKASAQGRSIHRELKRQITRLARLAVSGLAASDCARLVELLRRVKANLDPQAG